MRHNEIALDRGAPAAHGAGVQVTARPRKLPLVALLQERQAVPTEALVGARAVCGRETRRSLTLVGRVQRGSLTTSCIRYYQHSLIRERES